MNKMYCTALSRINAALENPLCDKAATRDLQQIKNNKSRIHLCIKHYMINCLLQILGAP